MIFSKLPRKKKIGLFLAVLGVFSFLLIRQVVFPIIKKIQRVNKEIDIDIERLKHSLQNIEQKEEITKEYQRYSLSLNKDSSDEEEMAKILSEIESLARKAGINLIDVKPQQGKRIDFYQEYIVNLEAEGEIKALISFLYYLNTSAQLLRAEKLRISLKEGNPSVIKVSIEITKILVF